LDQFFNDMRFRHHAVITAERRGVNELQYCTSWHGLHGAGNASVERIHAGHSHETDPVDGGASAVCGGRRSRRE
jgi:hypothetical protein